jgi:hypothetical protein
MRSKRIRVGSLLVTMAILDGQSTLSCPEFVKRHLLEVEGDTFHKPPLPISDSSIYHFSAIAWSRIELL